MSNENSPEKRRGISLPMLMLVTVLAQVGGIGLALLLIPQLSVRAAVRGGTIAIGVTLMTLLIPRVSRRFRQRRGGE